MRHSDRLGWPSLTQLVPLVGALTVVISTLPLRTFYGSFVWLPILVGAVALGLVIGTVAARWHWRLAPTAGVAVLTVAIYALYVGYRSRTIYGLPGPRALDGLGSGLIGGPVSMLTVGLPADATGDVIVAPVILVFSASLAGVLLAMRTRLVTALAAPPLVVFIAGLLVTAARPGRWMLPTLLLGGVTLALLLLRTNSLTASEPAADSDQVERAVGADLGLRRWHSAAVRVGIGLPLAMVAALLGTVGAAVITGQPSRADPRSLVHPHVQLADQLSPIVQVKPQLVSPQNAALFRVRVESPGSLAGVDRIRIAALDQFNGSLWSESREFLVAGSTLDRASVLKEPRQTISLDVHVLGSVPEPFLPVVGQPTHVHGDHLAFDPSTGTLVSTLKDLGGFSYSVEGEVASSDGIESATVPSDMAELTSLPDAPAWLTARAAFLAEGQPTPFLALSAIEKQLHSQKYSASAMPGNSYGAVQGVVTASKPGYAEQYASAFAMMARADGYPARVAIGYILNRAELRNGWYTIRSHDIHAWPEVLLRDYGWQPFEPTNFANHVKTIVVHQRVLHPKGHAMAPQSGPSSSPGGHGSAGAANPHHAAFSWERRLSTAAGFALLLVAGTVTTKALRRRRRRRRGTDAARIAAAWRETKDRLREAGRGVPVSSTPVEVARDQADHYGKATASKLTELADIVTWTVCGPEPPSRKMPRAHGRSSATFVGGSRAPCRCPPGSRRWLILDLCCRGGRLYLA